MSVVYYCLWIVNKVLDVFVTQAVLGLRVRLYTLALFNVLIVHGWIGKHDDTDLGGFVEDNYFINVVDRDDATCNDGTVWSVACHWIQLCRCFELEYRRPEAVGVEPGRICVVMLATPNILNYSQHAISANKLYSEHHGYGFRVFTEGLDPVRHPSWHKIRAVQQVLETGFYDYVFWIDADAVFTDFDARLEEICRESDFSFTTDPPMWSTLANGGVWMVRNTPGGRNFLARVWASPDRVEALGGYVTRHPWEQAAINYELLHMEPEELPGKACIMDSSAFNYSFQTVPWPTLSVLSLSLGCARTS